MDRSDFYETLNNLPQCYRWGMEDSTITATKTRGNDRGETFNPVTAVAHKKGLGTFSNNKKETLKALRLKLFLQMRDNDASVGGAGLKHLQTRNAAVLCPH